MDKEYLIEELSSTLEEIGQLSHWPSHYHEESDLLSLQDTLSNTEDQIRKALKTIKMLRKSL